MHIVPAGRLAVHNLLVGGVKLVAADWAIVVNWLSVAVVVFRLSGGNGWRMREDFNEFRGEECELVGNMCRRFQRSVEDLALQLAGRTEKGINKTFAHKRYACTRNALCERKGKYMLAPCL